MTDILFKDFLGKTFTAVSRFKDEGGHSFASPPDEILSFFCPREENYYVMICEEGEIQDISGTFVCLLNSPILVADIVLDEREDAYVYRLGTIQGNMEIRWCHDHNGDCVRSSVECMQLTQNEFNRTYGHIVGRLRAEDER